MYVMCNGEAVSKVRASSLIIFFMVGRRAQVAVQVAIWRRLEATAYPFLAAYGFD